MLILVAGNKLFKNSSVSNTNFTHINKIKFYEKTIQSYGLYKQNN